MFQGYTDETFEFFMAIGFNNNTEFFHGNRDWYLRAVREPSLALAEALAPTVEQIDDTLERRPNRVLSRINRDIRFSNDKSPYRDYLWLSFRRPKEERHTHPELYFELSCSGGSYGMGYYHAYKPMMNALRRSMLIEPERALAIFEPIMDEFALSVDIYRRMPIPDAIPEKLRVLYPAKNFYFSKPIKDFNLIKSPALADEIRIGFQHLRPLMQYLQALTPIEDEDVTILHPET